MTVQYLTMLYQLYVLLKGINFGIYCCGGEAVVTNLQVTYHHWSGRTEQTHENPQSCV
jgi:hypothetical protein